MPHHFTQNFTQDFSQDFRRAQTADGAAITALLDFAFGPGRLTRMAARLREGNQQIARLAYIIGDTTPLAAISYWPIRIGDRSALLLGPLVVHPDKQRQGLGGALMQHTLKLADATDFRVVLLVGDLPFYKKAGFTRAPEGIIAPAPVDFNRLLVRGDKQLCQNLRGKLRAAPDLC